MKNTLIAPSVLAADFANLQRDIEMINNSEADWFHIDIMDGVFVPNISFGMPVLDAINKHAKKTIDVQEGNIKFLQTSQTNEELGEEILSDSLYLAASNGLLLRSAGNTPKQILDSLDAFGCVLAISILVMR